MCGAYGFNNYGIPADVWHRFVLQNNLDVSPSYNIRPSQEALIVTRNSPNTGQYIGCVELIGCAFGGVGEAVRACPRARGCAATGIWSRGCMRTRLAPGVVVVARRPVMVTDILDRHVVLDVECFDRIYLNGWVPTLQVPGQVVGFLTQHLGFAIPSPALLEKIGSRFRKAVGEFAREHDITVIRFAKGERKLELMRPYLNRLVRAGRTGAAAIGVAQYAGARGATVHGKLGAPSSNEVAVLRFKTG